MRRQLAVTAGVGISVALMPAIPATVRDAAAVASLASWVLVTGGVVFGVLRAGRASWPAAIGATGVAMAILAGIQLEVVRLAADRPALVWNIDWRYALSHAQAIGRNGDLTQALDYAGAPISYHVGPAWLAAGVQRLFGEGMTVVLFGLTPMLSSISFVAAATYLLRLHGVSRAVALAAVGIAMTLPGLDANARAVYAAIPAEIVIPRLWVFSNGLMLNSYLALAAGFSAVALLLDRRSNGLMLLFAATALAAVVALKPQFFVGVGLFAGLTAADRAVRHRSVPAAVRGRALLATGLSLILAVGLVLLLPHSGGFFGSPRFAPGATGVGAQAVAQNTTLLFVVVLLLTGRLQRRAIPENLRACRRSMIVAGVAIVLVVAFLAIVLFPIQPEIVARVQRMGAATFSETNRQSDLLQSLLPLQILLVIAAFGVVALASGRMRPSHARLTAVAAVMIVLSPAPFLAYGLLHPERGFEAAEDSALLDILRSAADDGRLSVASDLADPAEDYVRPLRALSLTAYTGRPFFAANFTYDHFVEPDAPARLDDLRAFFGSPWSPWHTQWLRTNRIGSIFVNDRCRPAWLNSVTPLVRGASRGRWTVLVLPPGEIEGTVPRPAVWSDIVPAYGRAECLLWRRHRRS